ncbi:MAG: hypothetical protein IJ039_06095 [Clostridia bacterium]|nr:hypothetical protein [Clostridia bacterium]
MNNDISRKIIDVTGVELMPGKPDACLGNGERALSVVATSATIICVVSPKLISKSKRNDKKLILTKKPFSL